ncbi:MAG: hypothetical protein ISS82_00745 [Nanoarchaeota archaeon]|nr:hypothetical protein [Nanoarchaeota archaeon]
MQDWIGVEDILSLKEGESHSFTFQPDLNFIGKKVVENLNGTFFEGDQLSYLLDLEIKVKCSNCESKDIIHSPGWYQKQTVICIMEYKNELKRNELTCVIK